MKTQGLIVFLTAILLLTIALPAQATAPCGAFVSAITSGTAPLTVQFIDYSTNTPTSWTWSFGDGNTSTSQNPSHTYDAAGSYTVTLTVTNDDGSDTISKSGYITVTQTAVVPVAAFVAATTSGTAPMTVQFADLSTNTPASWAWSFGDGGTSTDQNPAHTYTAAGTYTVTLTAINSGGSDTASKSGYITVTGTASVPMASFVSAVTSGSVPLTVQFADSSTNSPTSWVWSFGDGDTSTLQNPSHIYETAGTYTVTLTATNSAGSDTVSEEDYITITDSVPVASFTSNVTSSTVPFSVQFTDTSTNYPTSWYWYFGDGGTSTDQDPVYEYEDAGTYTVTLTVSNSAGSNSTYSSGYITASAATVPVVSFSADTRSGTYPLIVQFSDTSTNTPTSWLWSFGDGTSSTEENPAHTYTAAGSYTVSLTAYNDAGSRTASKSGYIIISSPVTATTVPVTTVKTAVPVTPVTTVPATAVPEITPWPDAASTTDDDGGISGMLLLAVLAIGITGITIYGFLKLRGGRLQRWDF